MIKNTMSPPKGSCVIKFPPQKYDIHVRPYIIEHMYSRGILTKITDIEWEADYFEFWDEMKELERSFG